MTTTLQFFKHVTFEPTRTSHWARFSGASNMSSLGL